MSERPPVFIIHDAADQISETLSWMNRLANEQKFWPGIVAIARGAVAGVEGPQAEAEAVRQYVKRTIVFRMDPAGVEYLQAPDITLTTGVGDCDDMGCLAQALLAAIGHECVPLGVMWTGDQWPSHAVAFDKTANCIVDPVADVPCDAWPPNGFTLGGFAKGVY